jgi:hypothetical protein
MRFGKLVQVAIGFAAASGAFLLLSSNALAADAGSVTSSQPSLSGLASGHIDTPSAPKAPTDATGSTATITTTGQSSSTGIITGFGSESSGSGGSSVMGSTTTDTSPVNESSSSDGSSSTLNGVTSTNQSSSNGSGGAPVSDASTTGASNIGTNQVASAATTTVLPTADPILPSIPVATNVVPVAIHYRSAFLAVQPTILTRDDAGATDLASAVPSAPVPTKAPGSPAKSSGAALERLTSSLETSIVPPAFFLSSSRVEQLKLILLLVVIVVSFANLVVMTYGLWLRKGGYATAARSDSPNIAFTSPFATPFLLGYASALPRSHGPSFMVSNCKIGTTLFAVISEAGKSA